MEIISNKACHSIIRLMLELVEKLKNKPIIFQKDDLVKNQDCNFQRFHDAVSIHY